MNLDNLETTLSIDAILNADNIAEELTDKDLQLIGSEVVKGYDTDKESRSDWDKRNADAMKLALQVTEAKTTPWPKAANVKYPLLTTAALQFSARAYPALIPGTNVVKGRVVGKDYDGSKLERAIRIGKHMSYQLLEQMEDWEEEMDKLCLTLPILGCVFKKTYYDEVLGHNVSEVVYPKDLVVNYFSKTLESADRVTHCLSMSENDVYERIAMGVYRDVELEKVPVEVSDEDKDRGLEAPNTVDDTTPYKILEQHCLMDLDDDGYAEPYIVTVEEESEEVLRIVPRFNEEAIIDDGDGGVIRIEADQYFTKYGFIPSPDGSIYDIGFGTLLGPINDTINTLINQLLDAGTLSNLQVGFISKGIRVKGGNSSFKPGEWKHVEAYGDDLRKGIYPLPTREPSNVLFTLLNTIVDSGEKLSSVSQMMTGEIPGQNVKATVALAAIEQGMKVFNSIYKRIYRSMKKEFKKLYKLNSEYLSEEEYFMILDIGQEQAASIRRSDYTSGDYDVVPYADQSIATEEQKLAKLQALGEVLQLGTINPQEYTRRYLEATEQPNMEVLMQMPQPQPNPELQFEMMKFQDESQRAWQELKIRAMEVESKVAKEEIEGIVKLSTAKQAEVRDAVNAIQNENKIEIERNKAMGAESTDNESDSEGLESTSNNS